MRTVIRPLSVLILSVAAALAGCATSNPDLIQRSDAQRLASVQDATVLNVRPVVVDGTQNGGGAVTGAVVGGMAGGSVGGRRETVAVGVIGAVVGAVAGNAIERATTREEAFEILVQLKTGERRAIVQAKGSEVFAPGDAVILVSNGAKVRVMHAPAVVPASPAASSAG